LPTVSQDIVSSANAPAYVLGNGETLTLTATISATSLHKAAVGIFAGLGSTLSIGGDVFSAGSHGIKSSGGGLRITVAGSVHGVDAAISLGGNNNTIVNSGLIEGGSFGVVGCRSLTNKATIVADTAVRFDAGGILNNSGTIGNHETVIGISGSAGADTVVNSGVILGIQYAVALNGGNDVYRGSGYGLGGHRTGVVDGGTGNDSLTGTFLADVLRGGAGNDTLIASSGADTLDGGPGNDIYLLAADPVSDALADVSGIDTVFASSNRTIAAWDTIENLMLQGIGDFHGVGNDANNTIVGNHGDNTLRGDIGHDVLKALRGPIRFTAARAVTSSMAAPATTC
jgi:serralysin